jgi:PKD repeat protein
MGRRTALLITLVVTLLVTPAVAGPAVALERSTSLSTAAPASVSVGERVTLQAQLHNATDGSYTWDFDDGSTGTGWLVSTTYDDPGQYSVIVTAYDGGVQTTDTVRINVYPDSLGIGEHSNSRIRS